MADVCRKVDSERHHFMMYWNVAKYEDGTRYVCCDELEDYTFYPYVGTLKEIPGYSEDRTAFEDVRIFLIINTTGKLVKVPCNIVEEFKKIYINEGNFNKYWKMISENICRSIRRSRNLNSDEVPQLSMNEHVDLALVENPSRSARIGQAYTIEYTGKEIDIETQRMISKRASAMEDNRMRFVYAQSDQFIHDKSCKQVENIKYWDFAAVAELPKDREFCPHCRRKILIRNAIKCDTKRFAWYQRFFEKGRVSNRVLEKFLLGTDVKLHMDMLDELIVKCNEDTWHIKMNSQGTYSVYHNNYVMISDEERYITSGFHLQKRHPSYLSGILTYIQAYDWQKHLAAKAVVESEPVIQVEMEEKTAEEKVSVMRRLVAFMKLIFVKRWCKINHEKKECS